MVFTRFQGYRKDVYGGICGILVAQVIGFAVMRVIGALFLNETPLGAVLSASESLMLRIRAANSDGEAEVPSKS